MAAGNPYEALGVPRTASDDDIRAAYRKLAKKYHPDLNPGDKKAEERFKSISAANELLSDPEKRARFDRGEIDADGQERHERPYYRRHAEGADGGKYANMGADDIGDIFADFFSNGGGGPQRRSRGRDMQYSLVIEFLESVRGGTKRLDLPDGRSLDVKIPAGIESGQVMRLSGQGGAGRAGGPAGDALIEITVSPHPFFRREGADIHLEVPVTVTEAVLGARITVPTPTGPVAITVPKRSDAGTRMRLRGKGIALPGRPPGDQYVTLKLVLGPVDEAFEAFLRSHPQQGAADPRQAMTGAS
jgi:DnaJ-class molecular chaperone